MLVIVGFLISMCYVINRNYQNIYGALHFELMQLETQ